MSGADNGVTLPIPQASFARDNGRTLGNVDSIWDQAASGVLTGTLVITFSAPPQTLGEDPFSGTIFIFRAKRADRVKILAWDGSGLALFWKRLEHGAFKWPPVSDGVMRLTGSQLAVLVDGMDWSRLHARDVARPTATS